MEKVPVLIIGGGPIGLTAALLLSQQGIKSVVVEKRHGVIFHPKARSMERRTMEIYRQLGVSDRLEEDGLGPFWTEWVEFTESLSGKRMAHFKSGSFHSVLYDYSPSIPVMSTQDVVEPVLRDRAHENQDADIRYGMELVDLQVNEDNCVALIRSEDEAEHKIQADYVISADGVRSSVRDMLGCKLTAEPTEHKLLDVMFNADISPWVGNRKSAVHFVQHERGVGAFQPLDGKHRWRVQIISFASGVDREDATVEDCAHWLEGAMGEGSEGFDFNIQNIIPWRITAALSDTFSKGRAFLAGDAAHILNPAGGLGMCSGVHGIHNLAWKIAAVLKGEASEKILDTYDIERQPVMERNRMAGVENLPLMYNVIQTYNAGGDADAAAQAARQYANFDGLMLGFEYESDLVIPDGTPAPEVENPMRDLVSIVRPGRRAPHVWLDHQHAKSSIDLFGREHVLLLGSSAPDVQLPDTRFPIRTERLPASVCGGDSPYDENVAVLVRPDGMVATCWDAAEGSLSRFDAYVAAMNGGE